MRRYFIHEAMQFDIGKLMKEVDPAQDVTELSMDANGWFAGNLKARVIMRDKTHASVRLIFTFPDGEAGDQLFEVASVPRGIGGVRWHGYCFGEPNYAKLYLPPNAREFGSADYHKLKRSPRGPEYRHQARAHEIAKLLGCGHLGHTDCKETRADAAGHL